MCRYSREVAEHKLTKKVLGQELTAAMVSSLHDGAVPMMATVNAAGNCGKAVCLKNNDMVDFEITPEQGTLMRPSLAIAKPTIVQGVFIEGTEHNEDDHFIIDTGDKQLRHMTLDERIVGVTGTLVAIATTQPETEAESIEDVVESAFETIMEEPEEISAVPVVQPTTTGVATATA